MINNISSVKIGQVWNAARGTTFNEQIQAETDFGSEITALSPVHGELMLIRMKEGVMAVISGFSITVQLTCSRCLDNYPETIEVESFERLFYEHKPSSHFDPLETFLIDLKHMSIDLTDSIRQEIILHFPMIPVCSERCKGLCSSCSVNLNREKHRPGCHGTQNQSVPNSESEEHKPFAHLKDLLNK